MHAEYARRVGTTLRLKHHSSLARAHDDAWPRPLSYELTAGRFGRFAFNSAKQFVESPDFDDAVTGAVADNQGAHEKMSDYFFTNAPGRSLLISDIAKWFYQVVSTEHANT
jgi:hypothetical protein